MLFDLILLNAMLLEPITSRLHDIYRTVFTLSKWQVIGLLVAFLHIVLIYEVAMRRDKKRRVGVILDILSKRSSCYCMDDSGKPGCLCDDDMVKAYLNVERKRLEKMSWLSLIEYEALLRRELS